MYLGIYGEYATKVQYSIVYEIHKRVYENQPF